VSLSILPTIARANSEDDKFQQLAAAYIEAELSANPEEATELGDTASTTCSRIIRTRRATALSPAQRQFQIEANAIDPAKLSQVNNVELRILKDEIDRNIFELEELKDADWNPLVYMQSLANSLYLLVARDFAQPEKRIPNLRQRMERIPRVIAQAKANLQHPTADSHGDGD
jgi:uncharacterized protein (DUF885 family)